ncbi:RNA polymerase sigma-I factor [Desulfosporosinus shakirovi]|uniref:RNA polymerase sigma-I factor n=1 Tax=Desulfosporosinus shakirovi TaxID=2885154 RepID=UPI001E49A82A|nr:RNA polymerase sigma-I factor [Desulfosporosinus sp. SRJS8]MCB8816282.1 RNA polymerase sigma-I factor [Desulfosporosinus sp. SRJS8]
MQDQVSQETLLSAKNGDTLVREELIRSHKTFIAQVSSKICNRYLTWDNDDELSIALLAFNEAIDTFDPHGGASFLSFVQMVIRRRLVDFFRKEGKHQHRSLSPMNLEDEELSRFDLDASQEQYQETENQDAFAEVIEGFILVLSYYNVTLDDLLKVSPKQRDSKQNLLRAALALSNNPGLMEYLKTHRLLPIKELEVLTGVKRKALEKGRKYLIALALILSEPSFYPLKTFMQIPAEPGEAV